MSTAQQRRIQQQTLTQIDFPCPTPHNSSRADREAKIEEADEEWSNTRPRKKARRQRGITEAERARQQTLTQIGYVGYTADIEDGNRNEGDLAAAVGGEGLDDDGEIPAWYRSFLDQEEEEVRVDNETPDESSFNQNGEAEGSVQPQLLLSCTSRRSQPDPHISYPQTPHKPIRAEIPSSQSPTGSLLSTQQTPQSQHQRTPLSEIHENILAQRDAESPCKRQALKKGISPSTVNEGCDPGDLENLDPDSRPEDEHEISKSLKWLDGTNATAASIKQEPRSQSSPMTSNGRPLHQSLDHARKTSNFLTPSKRPSLDSKFSPRLYTSKATKVKQETTSQPCSPGPRSSKMQTSRTIQTHYQAQAGPPSTSQATTVDLTQPPRSPHPQCNNPIPHRNIYSPHSSVEQTHPFHNVERNHNPRYLQQYSLATIDSQLLDEDVEEDLSNLSPLASIKDKADIVTFSSDEDSDLSDD